jgi:DNA-directed RNA polymerase II subunit RPB1
MSLSLSVYQPLFVKACAQWLDATCVVCSRLRLTPAEAWTKAARWVPPHPVNHLHADPAAGQALLKACARVGTCSHCGAPQPAQFSVVKGRYTITRTWTDKRTAKLQAFLEAAGDEDGRVLRRLTRDFTAGDAGDTLSALHADDLLLIGLQGVRPRDCVMRHLYVLSPKERPTVKQSEGSRRHSHDDMWAAYGNVRRADAAVRAKLLARATMYAEARGMVGLPTTRADDDTDALMRRHNGAPLPDNLAPMDSEDVEHLSGDECAAAFAVAHAECMQLQQAVASVWTADAMSDADRNRCRKSPIHLRERGKGKRGRARGTLPGVRVNHAARGVITASTTLEIDQVGIPFTMARVLVVPERVHARSVHELRRCVVRGHGVTHGATHIVTGERGTLFLRNMRASARADIDLAPGDIVFRHLRNDDVVLLNRQPTLHRASIMAMRVVLVRGMSLQLRVTVTSPFNADFDGDEMNVHVLQSVEARAEALTLMGVARNLTAPQHSGVHILPVQDELLGLREMSRRDVVMDVDDVMDVWGTLRHRGMDALPSPDTPPTPAHPCGQWSGRSVLRALLPSISIVSGGVRVCAGALAPTSAPLHKGAMAALIRQSVCILGHDHTMQWLSDITRAASAWLSRRGGISVGPRDTWVPPAAAAAAKAAVDTIVDTVHAGTPPRDAGLPAAEASEVERSITMALATASDVAYRIVRPHMPECTNAIARTVAARSKGSKLNMTQLIVGLGQQIVGGGRPGSTTTHTRTLPHFSPWNTHPRAKGFITTDFTGGLGPADMLFHLQGAVEGLVNTAVSTAQVGYVTRRLMYVMGSHVALPHGAVGTLAGRTLQLTAGGDGLHPQALHHVPASWLAPRGANLPPPLQGILHAAAEHMRCRDGSVPRTARIPMDIDVFWRTWADSRGAAPQRVIPDGSVALTRFEGAVVRGKRVMALEQDAPASGGGVGRVNVWEQVDDEFGKGVPAQVIRSGAHGMFRRVPVSGPVWEGAAVPRADRGE